MIVYSSIVFIYYYYYYYYYYYLYTTTSCIYITLLFSSSFPSLVVNWFKSFLVVSLFSYVCIYANISFSVVTLT